MLPKANRLKKGKYFKKVFEEGRGFKEGPLYLKIKENNLAHSRFGFTINKRVSKKAVVRNRIKRKLREVVKEKLPNLIKKVDGVIVIMPEFEEKELENLKEVVKKLFLKAKIIHPVK